MLDTFASQFSSQSLADGQWRQLLPEFYELKAVTENNPWHVHQVVFDHAVAVIKGLEETISLTFLSPAQRDQARRYLDQKIERHTYLDILWVATLLHDIGKTKLWLRLGDTVTCPGHEIMSTAMVPTFRSRFELGPTELERVTTIVRYHGFTSDIVQYVSHDPTKSASTHWTLFDQIVGTSGLDLGLLMRADLLGSDLKTTQPDHFQHYLHLTETYIANKVELLDL